MKKANMTSTTYDNIAIAHRSLCDILPFRKTTEGLN